MNNQCRFANARIKPSGPGLGRRSIIGWVAMAPARSKSRLPGSIRPTLPAEAALAPGRNLMIQLGWIRLFYAIVSKNYVPPA